MHKVEFDFPKESLAQAFIEYCAGKDFMVSDAVAKGKVVTVTVVELTDEAIESCMMKRRALIWPEKIGQGIESVASTTVKAVDFTVGKVAAPIVTSIGKGLLRVAASLGEASGNVLTEIAAEAAAQSKRVASGIMNGDGMTRLKQEAQIENKSVRIIE